MGERQENVRGKKSLQNARSCGYQNPLVNIGYWATEWLKMPGFRVLNHRDADALHANPVCCSALIFEGSQTRPDYL